MQAFFSALLELIREPLRPNGGVKTDSSILLIYPPEKELDFREYLMDAFVPQLKAEGVPFRLLDLAGFLFEGLNEETIQNLQEDEFDDYRWMKQGLSTTVEAALRKRISQTAEESRFPGCTGHVYATVALHPLVRFGEVLRELPRRAVPNGVGLLPFVEKNFNSVEFGPRGTGKSFVYQQMSPYCHLISGGQTTTAQMFVNLASGQRGWSPLGRCRV